MSAHIVSMIASAGSVAHITEILKDQNPEVAYDIIRQAQVKLEEALEVEIKEKRHIDAMMNLSKLAAMDDLLLKTERRMNAALYAK